MTVGVERSSDFVLSLGDPSVVTQGALLWSPWDSLVMSHPQMATLMLLTHRAGLGCMHDRWTIGCDVALLCMIGRGHPSVDRYLEQMWSDMRLGFSFRPSRSG